MRYLAPVFYISIKHTSIQLCAAVLWCKPKVKNIIL